MVTGCDSIGELEGRPVSILFLIIIAAVIVVVFWRPILAIGCAAAVIGFVFLLVTSLLAILHGLHGLIP